MEEKHLTLGEFEAQIAVLRSMYGKDCPVGMPDPMQTGAPTFTDRIWLKPGRKPDGSFTILLIPHADMAAISTEDGVKRVSELTELEMN